MKHGFDAAGAAQPVEWGNPDPVGWRQLRVVATKAPATLIAGPRCYTCKATAIATCAHPMGQYVHCCAKHALGVGS